MLIALVTILVMSVVLLVTLFAAGGKSPNVDLDKIVLVMMVALYVMVGVPLLLLIGISLARFL